MATEKVRTTGKSKPEAAYEVEEIIAERSLNGKVEYFVKWTGYPIEAASWVPPENLHCPELFAKYKRAKHLKERREHLPEGSIPPNWKVKRVLSFRKASNQLYALVEYENGQKEAVNYLALRKRFPSKLFEFFEKKTNFQHEGEKISLAEVLAPPEGRLLKKEDFMEVDPHH